MLSISDSRESEDPLFPLDSRFRGNDDMVILFCDKPFEYSSSKGVPAA